MDYDSWLVEKGTVPSAQDILHYDSRLETTVLTVQGSDDEADLWLQNDKENDFGSIVADTMYTNGHIRALRYCCNGNGSNSNSEESTSIIRMADATKVCLLTGLQACGNRIRHLTLLSSLSSPPMSSTSNTDITEYSPYSREGLYFYDERAYGRDQKRHRDDSRHPVLVSSTDAPETAWTMETTPQDVNHIMSATLLLSTTMWNCRSLKELVLELSTSSSGVCIASSGDDNETWKQVAFSLQKHPNLEIVRIRIRPSSSSHLNHERGGHGRREEIIDEQEDEELMALAPPAPGPLDTLVMKGLVTLPRLRIFEQRGHGNAATAAGDSAKLQASSLVALMMKVPSLKVLHYSNLRFATNFDSKAEDLHEWRNNKSSLRELDLSENSLTDHDVMAIAKLLQVKVWEDLRKINLLKNPDINYCGNVAISTVVQELEKKRAVNHITLLLSSFPLYPSDDEEEDDDDDGYLDQSSTSSTSAMLPAASFAFSPPLCGGGGGRQEHETPLFPSFFCNGTPPTASTATSSSSHEDDNNSNNNASSNNDMMTD